MPPSADPATNVCVPPAPRAAVPATAPPLLARNAAPGAPRQPSIGPAAQLAELRAQAAPLAARLQDELNRQPDSPAIFGRLLDLLWACRVLRGPNLESLTHFVTTHWHTLDWVREYAALLCLPRFLNVAIVGGRCNLHCRMCHGAQSPAAKRPLAHLAPVDFERLLAAAPTAASATFSAADSDPLLHPALDELLALARAFELTLDFFTNGQALTERISRLLVGGPVQTLNFSLDAATPPTYARIRGGRFDSVVARIERLQALKAAQNTPLPQFSLSFVALADNIEELPQFIGLAARLGAQRVYLQDLIGWGAPDDVNQPAEHNPDWCTPFAAAQRSAAAAGIALQVPERLAVLFAETAQLGSCRTPTNPASTAAAPPLTTAASASPGPTMDFCSWLQGLYIDLEGRFQPCCIVHNVADLGRVGEGPLHEHPKLSRVKQLLLAGKVFPACVTQRCCPYVQQQLAAHRPLQQITPADLA